MKAAQTDACARLGVPREAGVAEALVAPGAVEADLVLRADGGGPAALIHV